MKLKTFAIVIISSLFFASCKKDTANNCPKTMAGLAGTYTLLKIEAGVSGTYSDADDRDACEKDDHFVLNANGTVQYKDDGTVCDPKGDDAGTWTVDSNGKISITVSGDVYAQESTIASFDCSTLVITGTALGFQYRFTFKKQ